MLYKSLEHTDRNPYVLSVPHKKCTEHYVTVTGMLIDRISKQTILEVSSWGRKYYMSYEEYYNYAESYKLLDGYASNMLLLRYVP